LRVTLFIPAAGFGPVDLSHGFHLRISSARRQAPIRSLQDAVANVDVEQAVAQHVILASSETYSKMMQKLSADVQ
jgi:hypothetical protein